MIKDLLKIRISAFFSYLFRSTKNDKKKSIKFLLGALLVYSVAVFFFLFGLLFDTICMPFENAGLSWLYFSFASLIALTFCFIGSVFATYTQIYVAKDNELLLSMPIKPKNILASRLMVLLLLNYFFEAMIIIPAIVIYARYSTLTAGMLLILILQSLLLPFLSLTLSCIIGWLIANVSVRLKSKVLITTIFSLTMLLGYFYFYSKIGGYVQQIAEKANDIALAFKQVLFPLYHFGVAVVDLNIVSMLLFILSATVPFLITYAILSNGFIKIATTNKGSKKIKYKEKTLKVSGVKKTLTFKELNRFFTSPAYMLNAGLGAVFMLISPIALLYKLNDIKGFMAQMPELQGYVGALAVLILCSLATMCFISAPSISLEGKSLWLMQSFPINGSDLLLSKAAAHALICLPPSLISAAVLIIVFKTPLLSSLLILIVPTLMNVFCALFGVFANLKFPRFDYINETAAIKQSVSTLLSMFGSMGVLITPIILYFLILKSHITLEALTICFGILLLVLCAILYHYIKTKGDKAFANLNN